MSNENEQQGYHFCSDKTPFPHRMEPGEIKIMEEQGRRYNAGKPVIGLIANEVHHGVCMQRFHLAAKHLRHKYDFRLVSQFDMGKCDPFYWDAMIVFHPYSTQNELLVKRAKQQYGIPVIVDADDLITELPSDHPEFQAFQGSKLNDCILFADHFTTSTTYLQKVYGDLNKNITVIENCIEPKRYAGIDHGTKPYHAGFVVGWTGGQSHRPDLYNTGFVEGLSLAMEKCDDIRAHFHILCPQGLLSKFGSRVVYNPAPVDFLDYPSLCFTFPWDLCAVPLQDVPFNDAKSDLRLLDMAPFKIPCLASPRDQFARHYDKERLLFVQQDNAESWRDAIMNAEKDRSNLRKIADNAFEYVNAERTTKHQAEKWDEVLTKVLIR